MKTLKISLEYKCYPVWIYDEDGDIEDSYLPDDLSGDEELKSLFDSIQDRFNNLYLDENGEEDFQTENDFKNDNDRKQFYDDLNKAVSLLKERYSDKYIVEYNENNDL